MTDIVEEAPEELKPKRRKVTPAETAAKRKEPDFVSPIRPEEGYPPMEEPPVGIDDTAALAVLEQAAEIFAGDMSPAEAAKLRTEIGRGRISQTLHTKLVACMGAIGTVEKKGRNSAQNYDYQRAVDVTNEVRVAFATHGILLLTSIDEVRHEVIGQTRGGANNLLVTIQGTFTATDGVDSYTFGGAGMGVDTGDKGIYKAITGMLKYGLRTLLLLADEKMDPEVEREDERVIQGQSGPVTIQPTTVQGVSQGGRQAGATSAQINAIKRASSDLMLDAGSLSAMIVSILGHGPDYDMNLTETENGSAALDWIAKLSFQDAGKIAKALVEAAQSDGGA